MARHFRRRIKVSGIWNKIYYYCHQIVKKLGPLLIRSGSSCCPRFIVPFVCASSLILEAYLCIILTWEIIFFLQSKLLVSSDSVFTTHSFLVSFVVFTCMSRKFHNISICYCGFFFGLCCPCSTAIKNRCGSFLYFLNILWF